MVEDVVRELGHLSLGTRLKRIGETLQAQTQALLAAHGFEQPAAWFPLLAALDRLGALSVGELSQAIGVSQPVITRSLRGLEEDGLIQSETAAEDRRVRRIALSRKGRGLVQRSQREAWPAIEAAVAQACDGLKGDLLAQLAALEDALTEVPLQQRGGGMSELDRPVWASLRHQPHWGVGDERARRFKADINRFAATPDESADSLAALAALLQPGDDAVYLLQVPRIAVPPGLEAVREAQGVQMLATRRLEADDGLQVLGAADAADMLALATLTEPGPFLARTPTMGRFIGLRVDGRLVAMAGERMRFPGHVEVSGVCTHPDFRGRGLARRLSAAVTAEIQRRGEQPLLHAWTTNTVAIALYESLGFEVRTAVNVALLKKR